VIDKTSYIKSTGIQQKSVMLGFAGIIYLDDKLHDLKNDLESIDWKFINTDCTVKTIWSCENIIALSYQHTKESNNSQGINEYNIPVVDGCQGVFHGTIFSSDQDQLLTTKQFLEIYKRGDLTNLQTINGNWAGFIVDNKTKNIYFARDRIGIETLYIFRNTHRLFFTTDLRLVPDSITSKTDNQAIAEFLHYLYIPAPLTVYEDCIAVLPGHVLIVSDQIKQIKYSEDRFILGKSLKNEYNIQQKINNELVKFEKHLIKAVKDCLPEKGKVVLTISGGKDSSALAIALSKICPDRVLGLTVGQSEKQIDETKDAEIVCQVLGIDHIRYYPTDDELIQGFYKFTNHLDQPIGDPAAFPYYLGMSQLPDDCMLLLDGTGNDYYFGVSSIPRGVWNYKRRMAIENNVPKWLWNRILNLMLSSTANMKGLAANWSLPIQESFVAWKGWKQNDLNELFGKQIEFDHTYLWNVMNRRSDLNHIEMETEVICGVWEPHTAYRKAETLARALGKGIRFPFTDNRLAQYVNSLPKELKIKDNVNKQILRAYLKANLPDEIVNKPKMGFIFNLNRLLFRSSYKWIDYLMDCEEISLPASAKSILDSLVLNYRNHPDNVAYQHKLYTLMLLAFVLASKKGIQLEF
jgi:asparagine synthase (glutamine-hydrolysing)